MPPKRCVFYLADEKKTPILVQPENLQSFLFCEGFSKLKILLHNSRALSELYFKRFSNFDRMKFLVKSLGQEISKCDFKKISDALWISGDAQR